MDLADAGRRDRLRRPSGGTGARASSPSSLRTTDAASPGAIGGASAWRVASARCASSGRPSRMKPSSCPIFIIAPFICPSSRAASSAVRMTKRVSSSASRSSEAPALRTRCAVQSAPRRALSRHTRAERARRARRCGSRRATAPPRPPAARGADGHGAAAAHHGGGGGLRRAALAGGSRRATGSAASSVVRQRLAGDLARPVGAGVEPVERHLDPGQVLRDPVQLGRGPRRCRCRPAAVGGRRRRSREDIAGERRRRRASEADPCPAAGGRTERSLRACRLPCAAVAGVRLSNVSKRFGDVTAVDNVVLDIGDREFMVLLGPSGCGKSTLLRMIAGLEEHRAHRRGRGRSVRRVHVLPGRSGVAPAAGRGARGREGRRSPRWSRTGRAGSRGSARTRRRASAPRPTSSSGRSPSGTRTRRARRGAERDAARRLARDAVLVPRDDEAVAVHRQKRERRGRSIPRGAPYLVVYPFVKMRPWYFLPMEERGAAMRRARRGRPRVRHGHEPHDVLVRDRRPGVHDRVRVRRAGRLHAPDADAARDRGARATQSATRRSSSAGCMDDPRGARRARRRAPRVEASSARSAVRCSSRQTRTHREAAAARTTKNTSASRPVGADHDEARRGRRRPRARPPP